MHKHLLIPLVCLGFAASSAHANLIAHWKFDDGSGTTAVDSAGSNHGTLAGSPTWVTGKVGGALDFRGGLLGDVVQAPVAGLPTGNAARTVSLWLNADATATDQKFFSYGTLPNGTAFSWTLENAGGNPTVFFRFAGGNRQFTGTGVTLGEWTHVAIVVPDDATTVGNVLLYLNGAPVTGTSSGVTLNTGSSAVVIGGGGTVYPGRLSDFDGRVDDVQIYDRALSSTEVQSLFNNPGSVITESSTAVQLVDFTYNPLDGASEVSIKGMPSTAYILVEADDLDFSTPNQSPVPLTGATVGTLMDDQVITDENGLATVQFNLGTTKPATFIRGEEAPPLPPLLSEDFEGEAIPDGWVATDNGNGTVWSVGTPNGTGTEPNAAISGAFCAGTNMNGDYTHNAGCSFISPAFTVPSSGATLTLSYYIDTEFSSGGGDFGTIRLLNAADNTPLVGGDLATGLQGTSTAWLIDQTFPLPEAANGLSVKLEFAFENDDQGTNYAGFYIDAVEVTVD